MCSKNMALDSVISIWLQGKLMKLVIIFISWILLIEFCDAYFLFFLDNLCRGVELNFLNYGFDIEYWTFAFMFIQFNAMVLDLLIVFEFIDGDPLLKKLYRIWLHEIWYWHWHWVGIKSINSGSLLHRIWKWIMLGGLFFNIFISFLWFIKLFCSPEKIWSSRMAEKVSWSCRG